MSSATIQHSPLKWIFVVIPLLFSVAFFSAGVVLYPLPWESASWPQTPGVISDFTVTQTMNRPNRNRGHFDVIATYHYEIGGQLHSGNDAIFPLNRHHKRDSIDRLEAERRAEALQLRGKSVQVFYDPNDTSRSTLQPGMQSSIITAFLFGSIGLLVALSQAWSMRKRRH